MPDLPLEFINGHLFLILDGSRWLVDTGAPTSFGEGSCHLIDNGQRAMPKGYMGLTAAALSGFVGEECQGLIGADVLNGFDHVIDVPAGIWTVSDQSLEHPGKNLVLDYFMGIPIVTATIAGAERRLFFDTGAQVSYFQDEALADFPTSGVVDDFYPGFGSFQTATHALPVMLAGETVTLRCGSLPGMLGMSLMMADVKGILGNEILRERIVGFFPKRRILRV